MLTELTDISRTFRQLTSGQFIDGSPLNRPLTVREIQVLANTYAEEVEIWIGSPRVQVLLTSQLMAAVVGDPDPGALRSAIRLADKSLFQVLDLMQTNDICESVCL